MPGDMCPCSNGSLTFLSHRLNLVVFADWSRKTGQITST